ncbi:hypothetical protein [Oleiagrimonas soli]|uniref:Type VI secretion system protein n=1 Tax=Oleiagrimonas soli TaxID=1543381 RepID=A0A099CXB4_9GAMM|nr:hypothetical protein [Oleiagrimonas soli]KGI78272.1 hypothetical protein LF63_0108100 [Oleiagrimonas soli]MBB6183247.1 type VI secretion system protein [Oleiagrimonas soli]
MRRRHAIVLFALLASLLVSGCSVLSKLVPWGDKTTDVKDLRVVAVPDANADSATALDLVFVYDKTAAGLLPKTAPEWFGKKGNLVNGLGTSADIVSLQVTPASVVDPVKLPKRHGKAIAVYGFAGYLSPSGQGRVDLTGFKHPTIWLETSAVHVSEP